MIAQSLEIPSAGGLRLRQAYADAAGQGTVVWRLGPRGAAAALEIRETFNGLLGQESQKHEPSVANG